jgi:hypothetical protein
MEEITIKHLRDGSLERLLDEFTEQNDLSREASAYLNSQREEATNHFNVMIEKQTALSRIVDPNSNEALQIKMDIDTRNGYINQSLCKINEQIQSFQRRTDSSPISIMFVVVSMTIDEASDLEQLMNSATPDTTNLRELLESLQGYNVSNFTRFYRQNREEWIPYTHSNLEKNPIYYRQPISSIINNIIEKINDCRKNNCPVINPQFVSDQFFQSNIEKRGQFWEKLVREGGVIIVDAVSLFHPNIRRTLSASQVYGSQKVSILTISPINPCIIQTNQILEDLISSDSFEMVFAYGQFQKHFDRRCEMGLGDFRSINTWFYSTLQETVAILTQQKPQPENLELVRKRIGTERRHGYSELWRNREP